MIAIAAFGLIVVAISLVMILRPEAWARAALRFVRMPYMHPFEIASRLLFGALFVWQAEGSRYPTLIRVVGWALVAVGCGLALLPPSLHRRLGVWGIERFAPWFRPAGCASLPFGLVLIHAAL